MAKKFDRIIEMIEVITPQKVKNIEILDQSMRDDSKVQMLYDAILNNDVESEEEAVLLLYGDVDSKDSYYKVQQRLYDRLLNSFYFIDHKKAGFSDRQLAYYDGYRLWALARIVRERGAHNTAFELFEKSFKLSLKYDFNELVIVNGLELFDLYTFRFANKKQFDKLKKVYRDRYKQFIADIRSQEVFYLLASHRINSSEELDTLDEWEQIDTLLDEIKEYKKSVKSDRFIYYGHMSLIEHYRYLGKYDEVIELCEDAIENYEKKEYDVSLPVSFFAVQIFNACIQLGYYEKGEDAFNQYISLYKRYFYNWFVAYYSYLLMLTHQKKYADAYKVCSDIMSTKQYSDLPSHLKEYYRIINSYLLIALRISKNEDLEEYGEFRLYRFLNDIPIYSKDKRGLNISLLIFQFIYLLIERKYNDVIDRIDALNQYSYRYLRVDEKFRSNCFIKMLINITKSDFHPVRTEAYNKSLLKRLKETPRVIADSTFAIEVIPYENLWEIVMDILYKNLKEERGIDLRPERSR